jgi:hypothetical protein
VTGRALAWISKGVEEIQTGEGVESHPNVEKHDSEDEAPALERGRPSGVCVVASLSPLRGLLRSHLPPTAYAVGCILTPLRGLIQITRKLSSHAPL